MQKCLILLGDGQNGKSTLMRLVRKLVGDHNICGIPLAALIEKDTKRAQLENKLFSISEENKASSLLETDLFKSLIDGGLLDVKRIYVADYHIDNRAKFIISFNKMGASKDKTVSLTRRMRIIPFNQTFPIDNTIESELEKELSGVFNCVKKAYIELHERKKKYGRASMTESTFSDKALQEYKDTNDVVSQFLNEAYEIAHDPGFRVIQSEIYQEFVDFYESEGHEKKFMPSVRGFISSLKRFQGSSFDMDRCWREKKTYLKNLKRKEF